MKFLLDTDHISILQKCQAWSSRIGQADQQTRGGDGPQDAERRNPLATDSGTATKLVVAVSSRALFDLDVEHQVYVEQGLPDYRARQIRHKGLRPGHCGVRNVS